MRFKSTNVFNISDNRTEKKIKKKIEVLLEERAFASTDEAEQKRPCVIETVDGTFHKTEINYFDERGVFCSRHSGHCEFFDYHSVKNIF